MSHGTARSVEFPIFMGMNRAKRKQHKQREGVPHIDGDEPHEFFSLHRHLGNSPEYGDEPDVSAALIVYRV